MTELNGDQLKKLQQVWKSAHRRYERITGAMLIIVSFACAVFGALFGLNAVFVLFGAVLVLLLGGALVRWAFRTFLSARNHHA